MRKEQTFHVSLMQSENTPGLWVATATINEIPTPETAADVELRSSGKVVNSQRKKVFTDLRSAAFLQAMAWLSEEGIK